LIQLADSMVDLITRDMVELSAYGISPSTAADLETRRDALSDYPQDQYMLGTMMVATGEKDKKRDALETGIRQMATRVQNKYGQVHEHSRRLGVGAISSETDLLLARTGRRVAKVTQGLLAELATEGLTPAMHAAFVALVAAFDEAIDLQLDAQHNRDAATLKRIQLSNDLYQALLRVANSGKDAFYSTNEAKYNDYILIEKAPAKPKAGDGE
jgi:hypothetical protein